MITIKCCKCKEDAKVFDSLSESHDMCLSCYDEYVVNGKQDAPDDYENKEEDITPEMMDIASKAFEKLAQKQADAREKFMKQCLRKNLKWYDKPLFFIYRKLADRFGGGQRVITMQERDHLDGTRFGIKIYGVEYWMTEKRTIEY